MLPLVWYRSWGYSLHKGATSFFTPKGDAFEMSSCYIKSIPKPLPGGGTDGGRIVLVEDTSSPGPALETTQALAVDAKTLAGLLGVSKRHVRRMNSAGSLPRPIKLGRSVRWSVAEVNQWIEAGCPDRENWEAMKRASN